MNDKKYKYDKRKSLDYANNSLKSVFNDLYIKKSEIISIPLCESLGTLVLGVVAYNTHNIIDMCFTVGLGGITVVTSKFLYPSYIANKNQIKKIKEKRDYIFREQMQIKGYEFKKKVRK